jgi:hypothetical protein
MLAFMTSTRSFEHHPFSGPLIVLHTARQPLDYVVGGLLLALFGVGLCLPAFRRNGVTVIMSILSGAWWIGISVILARNASV